MVPTDYKVCSSKIYDLGAIVIGTLLLASFSRRFLFKQEIIGLENFMQLRDMDVKFWKALVAYTGSFCLGYSGLKDAMRDTFLCDLAI